MIHHALQTEATHARNSNRLPSRSMKLDETRPRERSA